MTIANMRTFVSPEGVRWIRLSSHQEMLPIWLAATQIEGVRVFDTRPEVPVFLTMGPDGPKPSGVPGKKLGDAPVYATLVETATSRWIVEETVDEVIAFLSGQSTEPAAVPI